MTNTITRFTSEYSRKEVDFLKTMDDSPKPTETESDLQDNWVVLITTRNVEHGISVCTHLREVLGSRVKVIRIDKPSTISSLRMVFDPEVILSDSNSIYQSENGTEADKNSTMNGMALFLNKKHSTFSVWICENLHNQSFFDAWEMLNDQ